ncbi:MAG: hypothetical protein JNL05_10555 [Flavobacteriales bacterium]|nr:hypothetical protein [Flavobacteriales bacterium]
MAQTNLINKFGRVSGWNDVQLVLFGRTVEGIQEFSYDDNQEKEAIKGQGGMPIGMGRGNYEAKCSITILMEEFHGLLKSLPAGKRLQEVLPTDVPVLYMQGEEVVKDVIRGFEFTGATKELKQGDKAVWVKLGVVCTHIDWLVQ